MTSRAWVAFTNAAGRITKFKGAVASVAPYVIVAAMTAAVPGYGHAACNDVDGVEVTVLGNGAVCSGSLGETGYSTDAAGGPVNVTIGSTAVFNTPQGWALYEGDRLTIQSGASLGSTGFPMIHGGGGSVAENTTIVLQSSELLEGLSTTRNFDVFPIATPTPLSGAVISMQFTGMAAFMAAADPTAPSGSNFFSTASTLVLDNVANSKPLTLGVGYFGGPAMFLDAGAQGVSALSLVNGSNVLFNADYVPQESVPTTNGSTQTLLPVALLLGSGLVDHSQKSTVAARASAEKKTVGQRS